KATASVLIYSGLENRQLVNAVYSLAVNISIGMFFLQALAGYPLSRFFGVPEVWPLTICTASVFLIGAGAGTHGAILQRRMQFKQLAIAESFSGIARFGTAITGALLGWGVWAFAIGEVVMAIVDAVLKRGLSQYPFRYHLWPDTQLIQQVGGYMSKLVGTNLAVYTNTNSDNFLIGKLLGTAALGYYNFAYQLAMLPTFALSKINRVTFSVLSQQSNDGKKKFLVRNLELYGLCFAPVYGVALLISPWIIPSIYGQEWKPAILIFQIILGYAYARGFKAILGITLNALNKPGTNAFINWLMVPISVPAFLVGAQLNGIVGVAISALCVLGAGATLCFWFVTCRAAGWHISTFIKPILFPTTTLIVSILITLIMPASQNFQFLYRPLIFLILYIALTSLLSVGQAPQLVLTMIKKAF
ncbi:MAG: oligosaccharide flippase family protein, partial [Leptolyngbya sp. SIO3F4]|nr:oligosaccharide flippase family protein [Leptolyngbya sp. SIO3F4]